MNNPSPPAIASRILERILDFNIRYSALGDFEEQFNCIVKERGLFKAQVFYWTRILILFPAFIRNFICWSVEMFKNYLKIACRNVLKTKFCSSINIIGLAVGIAVCLLILQYVTFELSYDKFHTNLDDIYRLELEGFAGSHGAAAQAVKEAFPEVRDYVKLNLSNTEGIYSNKDIKFREEKVFFATDSFFSVFSFNLLKGDPKTALLEVNTAVLSESTAKKYFGSADPVGKSIIFGGTQRYKITGIVEDVPANSHFHFDMLISWPTLVRMRGAWIESSWTSCPYYTYLLLQTGADSETFESKLKEFFEQKEKEINKKEREELDYHLKPLKDIHLYSNLDFEIEKNGDARTVYFLIIIALVVLSIGWINYINLSTARSMERAREIGIRKVVGAFRIQLIRQFLTESLLFNIAAVILAIITVQVFLPFFNQLTGTPLSFKLWSDARFWLVCISMFTLGVLLSGLYPAFVLSSFKPVAVLKGKLARSSKSGALRKCLVVFQFAASIALIAGTMTIYRQISFMKAQDLGVNLDQTLVVRSPGVFFNRSYVHFLNRVETFKAELERIPAVSKTTASTFFPGEYSWVRHSARRISDRKSDEKEFRITNIDNDFVDFYEIEILAGRNFSYDFRTEYNCLLINEEALKLFGFETPEDAINEQIIYGNKAVPLRIIGVIKNYHQESLKHDYNPTLFLRTLARWRTNFSLRVSTENLSQTISSIQSTWNRVFPGNPFEYLFLDEHFDRQYHEDRQFGKISGLFTFLAILIGCLGLFGLSSYNTILRTKEIGIRKVLGSSISGILILLLKDLFKLIFIAILLALPVSYFYFHKWLENYAFRIEIGWWFFSIPIMLILSIVLLTVGYNTAKSATANPVDSLRYE